MEVEASSTVVEGHELLNHSGLPDTVVAGSGEVRELARQLSTWVSNHRTARGRHSLFDRGAYTPPENVYDEMRAARHAVKYDDVVSGVAEITEAFAFQGVKWEAENPDDADIFNQINGVLNLDAVVRRMWREEYTYSTSFVAKVWGWREFTVRGRNLEPEAPLDKLVDPVTGAVSFEEPRDQVTNRPIRRRKGPKRKKKYRVWCPVQMRVLDATKIVPVGTGPLAGHRFAWQASEGEIRDFEAAVSGEKVDLGMTTFFLGPYTPDEEEKRHLEGLGVDTRRLLLMNPEVVFQHTLTKPDYERFPDIRLRSCFGLLDLKRQLINADRAMLVGAANYILLVRKGSKEEPASQAEIDHLKANYNFIAKLPVIISDHRLEIEIVAPKIDLTLQPDKYDVIDTRLLMRLIGTLSLGARGQRNETNITMSHALARAMENRRHMLKRTLERELAKAIVEHPRNRRPDGTPLFEEEPNLVYTPRNITLGFDASLTQALLNLRTQKEISRETILEYFGLDQNTEAMRREIEEDFFDAVFQTQVPFNGAPGAPGGANFGSSQANGAQGGRPVGGGQPPANATKATPKTPRGNSKKESS